MVQRVNFVKRIEMNVLLETWRNNSLDDLCLEQIIPMVLNFSKLAIKFLVLIVSELLNQLILLVNKSSNLTLFRGILSVFSQLLRQLLDGLVKLLDLISVLLVLFLKVEQQLLVIGFLLFDLCDDRLFLCKFFSKFLGIFLQVLTVSFLDTKDVFH